MPNILVVGNGDTDRLTSIAAQRPFIWAEQWHHTNENSTDRNVPRQAAQPDQSQRRRHRTADTQDQPTRDALSHTVIIQNQPNPVIELDIANIYRGTALVKVELEQALQEYGRFIKTLFICVTSTRKTIDDGLTAS